MSKFLPILITLLLLAACGGGAAAGAPRIALETTTLALGDMPNGEIAEREVAVRNDGDAPLVVETVMTSCGCTTAALEPMTIAPGESGTLRIAFDSGAHGPDLRGELLREVRLVSNDPATPEAVVALTANILPPQ
jgi:hypothetical protein